MNWHRVPIKDPKNEKRVIFENQPVLYPHQVLDYLFNVVCMDLDLSDRQQFWRHARNNMESWAVLHPASDGHHPVGLYGDSARLNTQNKAEKICGIFLSLVLFRPRSVRFSRFLLWSCDSLKFFKNRTTNHVLRIIVWSLWHCFRGVHPSFDLHGHPIQSDKSGKQLTPKKDMFAVVEYRGDWEWHKQIWRFDSSWKSADRVCYRCFANAQSYHDTSPHAQWMSQEIGVLEFFIHRLKDKHICDSAVRI